MAPSAASKYLAPLVCGAGELQEATLVGGVPGRYEPAAFYARYITPLS